MTQYMIEKQQLTTSENLVNGNYLLSQEILKMLMNQISSLKVLEYDSYSECIEFIFLPKAKIHLANLTELKCYSNICSEFFYQMTQICHNMQSLTIDFETQISNGLTDLISSQNNLKILKLVYFRIYYLDKIIPSLINHTLTLTKLTLFDCNLNFTFIAMIKNLQELNIDQKRCELGSFDLQYVYFSQLKILRIICFTIHTKVVNMLINFLEINGKNLIEFNIRDYYNNSLNLALAKFCPNLKILYACISEEETLKLILNNCQYLEMIKFC